MTVNHGALSTINNCSWGGDPHSHSIAATWLSFLYSIFQAQRREPRLPLDQRQRADIVAVETQKVEDEETNPAALPASDAAVLAFRLPAPSCSSICAGFPGSATSPSVRAAFGLAPGFAGATSSTIGELVTAHPLLREAIAHVAHYQIRNRGTVGGSLGRVISRSPASPFFYDQDRHGRVRDSHIGVIGACNRPQRLSKVEVLLNGRAALEFLRIRAWRRRSRVLRKKTDAAHPRFASSTNVAAVFRIGYRPPAPKAIFPRPAGPACSAPGWASRVRQTMGQRELVGYKLATVGRSRAFR